MAGASEPAAPIGRIDAVMQGTHLATRPPRADSMALPAQILLSIAFAYLGFDAAYPKIVSYEAGGVSIALALGLALAVLGWARRPRIGGLKSYVPWAAALGFWAVLSAVGAWRPSSVRGAVATAVWIVVIVPGLASLLRDRKNLNALLFGWTAAASVFVVVGGVRLLRGQPVLDVIQLDVTKRLEQGVILGVDRNAVNVHLLFIVPFLLAAVGPRPLRIVRWPLLGLSVLWLVYSGGRSGLAGLAVMALLFGMFQPGTSKRIRLVLAALFTGVLLFTFIQSAGGRASTSTERFTDLVRGKRSDGDEVRKLLLLKAWNLALEQPFFGIGFDRFETTYHPVVETASNSRVRKIVDLLTEHNTYAQVMGEMGFVGLFFFVGMFWSLLRLGLRNRGDPVTRTATCGFAVVAFVVFFQSALGVTIFYPMAVVLGASAAAHEARPLRDGEDAP